MNSDELKQQIAQAIGPRYGQMTVDLVAILYPPLARVGLADAKAVFTALLSRDADETLKAAYALMTNDELVEAKAKLVDLLSLRAGDNAAVVQAINTALLKAVEFALSLALVGL